MPRETDLLDAFIEFADTFIDEYDVLEFLNRLAERTVELLDATEAGIMLADRDGSLKYVASSTERVRLIEVFELQHDEGPCVDAYVAGLAVHSELDDTALLRWPKLTPRAREAGFRSVSALPMRLRSTSIGSLNLFSSNPRPMNDADRLVAQGLADIATIGILQERALSDAKLLSDQLETALTSRVRIEQAKGIVAQGNKVSTDAAFVMLRNYARHHNQLLGRVAGEIIDHTITAADLLAR